VLEIEQPDKHSAGCEFAVHCGAPDSEPWRLRFWLTDDRLPQDAVTVTAWRTPTRADGSPEPAARDDELVVPGAAWQSFGRWLGAPAAAPRFYRPYAFQSVVVRNTSSTPVPLVVQCVVEDVQTGEPATWFATPRNESRGGLPETASYLTVPPESTRSAVLPIYLAANTPPGEYRRRLTVTSPADGRTWHDECRPLAVVRPQSLYLLWVGAAAVAAVIWLGCCAVRYRATVRSFGLERLTLLALLGSLQFVITFVSGSVAAVLQAVLGPFNVLVGRLLTAFGTQVPLAATVLLVPRVGAVTISGTIAYLMGGMLFGAFGLTDVLFFAAALAVRETLLFLLGATRLSAADGSVDDSPKSDGRHALLAVAVALALAEAVNAFTTIATQATLYRLFFADWYVWLSVAVAGFLYTLPAAWLGAKLGSELRRLQT
jgi:hypothetical protein